MPYILADQTFPTKKALQSWVQERLRRPEIALTAPEQAVLADLVTWHPRASEKIGPGIRQIAMRPHPVFASSRVFWIQRTDGTWTDWSYRQCLTPPTPWGFFVQTARRVIAPQIVAFLARHRRGDGFVYCPAADAVLPETMVHVDHRPPVTFDRLVRDFVARESLDVMTVEYDMPDGLLGRQWRDALLESRWWAYHARYADLQILSVEAHRAITRQRRKEVSHD